MPVATYDVSAFQQTPCRRTITFIIIPRKTIEVVGAAECADLLKRAPHADYVVSGNHLNHLMVLTVRLNSRMVEVEELRGWQDALSMILFTAQPMQ